MFALTTKGSVRYDTVAFRDEDVFVFGAETRGLAPELRETWRSVVDQALDGVAPNVGFSSI